jgi:hypothetical protein
LCCSLWPGWSNARIVVKPETVVDWHRAGFRLSGRIRSRSKNIGKPKIDAEIREILNQVIVRDAHPCVILRDISLEADNRTGCMETTFKTLSGDLRKSKRSIGIYAAELHDKGVCKVQTGENQYCRTKFEILNDYWPYERNDDIESAESDVYVNAIRDAYLALDCTVNGFNSMDIQTAVEFEKDGVPLETVKDALLLGAIRKYSSWLDGKNSSPIGSLKYFKTLVTEIQKQLFPDGYRLYLQKKNKSLSK